LDQPKLVFFFDEAHLLFNNAPEALVDKVEQVVRLIRSKGVGVYFVTQNPLDIPDKILGQLGNRIQHALRAFTPRDQKAVQVAAETMRANPKFDAATVIGELGVGEALVSFLDEKGRPTIVERTTIFPPASRMGPLKTEERQTLIDNSPLKAIYAEGIDRESAYEVLKGKPAARTTITTTAPGAIPPPAAASRSSNKVGGVSPWAESTTHTPRAPAGGNDLLDSLQDMLTGKGGKREGVLEAAAKSAMRGAAGTVGRELGRQLLRGVLGSITK